MSEINLIAIGIASPAALFLLLRLVLFFWQRSQGPQDVQGEPRSEEALARRMAHRLQNIIASLQEDDPEDALQLTIRVCKNRPEHWSLLRQYISSLPPQQKLSQGFTASYKQALDQLRRSKQEEPLELSLLYTVLIGGSWYLNSPTTSLEIAQTWHELGYAYQHMAQAFPAQRHIYQETALHAYSHALYLYRSLNLIPGQLTTLCHIGTMFFQEARFATDPLAGWLSTLDYFEQAQSLLKAITHPSLEVIAEIYMFLGKVHYALYTIQKRGLSLQKALEYYVQLEAVYRQQTRPDAAPLKILQHDIGRIQQELQHIQQQSPAVR